MKKRLVICLVLIISICLLGSYFLVNNKSNSKNKTEELVLKNTKKNKKSIYTNATITDESLPKKQINKVSTGIEAWVKSSLAIDKNFSEENKNTCLNKLYSIIISSNQKEKVKSEQDKFYRNAEVTTKKVSIDLKDTKKLIYKKKKIGYVDCVVTIGGTRNKKEFKKIYDLSLLIEYQQEIVSIYEIDNIILNN